jgi:hypothetical protein
MKWHNTHPAELYFNEESTHFRLMPPRHSEGVSLGIGRHWTAKVFRDQYGYSILADRIATNFCKEDKVDKVARSLRILADPRGKI